MTSVCCESCGVTFSKKPAEIKRSPRNFCSKKCSGNYRKKKTVASFFSKATRVGDCLVWMGSKNKNGYGIQRYNGKPELAHRVSYELSHGRPGSSHVMHSCDNPSCIEPSHLSLGTHQDNMSDMDRKGRRATKLSADDVADIRRSERSSHELGALYGVSDRTIRYARTPGNWRSVSENTN